MAKRVKFSLLKIFFKLFSFLADKTDGWKIFVTPKLLLGTALLVSGNVYAQKPVNQNINQNDNVNLQTTDTISKKEIDENIITCYVPIKPRFPGGEIEMIKWLNENIIYPKIAQEQGIQGKVFVKFIVEKDGSIIIVEVVRGVHSSLDEEAIRLVKSMPKWEWINKTERKERAYFTLPITFIIKKDEEQKINQ